MHTGDLDATVFHTVSAQRHKRSDNSWVMHAYNKMDLGRTTLAYAFGQIVRIFAHTLRDTERIVIECDWYEVVGLNPVSKLRQCKRNLHFDACRHVFLDKCHPDNFVLWSSDPRDAHCELYDVVAH